ncbi:hypothetical protein Rhe02_55310 [Rhizocola hellebori]|uniref:Tyr recombinase domain-containing protein n=1 Tax=Rhizocola hellebori TaxID=1392758 RepID=A0A8J3VHJ6_9ACTN|nr:hypothetical protein Rhe02_55310 [Rhizocola hellebori]
MGHISKAPSRKFRANWRDVADRQKAKTFKTRKEAQAFLATTEASLNTGSYVDPHAGRMRFGVYAQRWLEARNSEATTAARDASLMRTHVLAAWAPVPFGKIDHLAVQQWVTALGKRLAPATVAKCHQLMAAIMRSAMRDRIIGVNPCDGVRLPKRRTKNHEGQTVTPTVVVSQLLPALPARHWALVALAAGTGLRWGECVGLGWDAVDLVKREVHVLRVEVAGTVSAKPFPKSKAGRRAVPLPELVVARLRHHREMCEPGPAGEVFTNEAGGRCAAPCSAPGSGDPLSCAPGCSVRWRRSGRANSVPAGPTATASNRAPTRRPGRARSRWSPSAPAGGCGSTTYAIHTQPGWSPAAYRSTTSKR